MAVSRLSLETSSEQLSRAIDALRQANDSLAERIPDEMRQLANRLAAVARAKVLDEPVHGIKQRGLRGELSAGVGVEDIPGGARITTSMPNLNERNLPADTDQPARGWMHPVFGNRSVWVHESFAFSWFADSVASIEAWSDGRDALGNLLDQVAQQIADETSA